MEFKNYLIEQAKKHPSMQPSDVAKMCYQSALGAEHLLLDIERARAYFDMEYASVEPREGEIFECLSDNVCRIDLGAWKNSGLPSEYLFRMFVASASISQDGREKLVECIESVELCLGELNLSFSLDDWKAFLEKYRELGMPAIHHSDIYRNAEKPAYRIVDRKFTKIIELLKRFNEISGEKTRVLAIDGRAAAGKTTLASLLQVALDAEVVHVDDFFLPPALRTPERLAEAGGNIHYERFIKEVIPFVGGDEGFSYGKFDCSVMSMNGEREIKPSKWRIVEGSYSCHPKFGRYADLTVFCSVSPEKQMERILARNGEWFAEKFKNEWIPMEERYFEAFNIREEADTVIYL